MIAQPQRSGVYSIEEYLEVETASEQRHEYWDGDIIAMTGGTPNHNRIIRNLCTALTLDLRGQPYETFVADQRMWIPEHNAYVYPDVMVIQGKLAYQEGRRDTLINPLVIVEVLSKSTRDYDRGDYDRGGKFVAYRTIPTLQEYVLVDQYMPHVERYAKEGEKTWLFQEYDRLDEQLELKAMPWAIALTTIYERVESEN